MSGFFSELLVRTWAVCQCLSVTFVSDYFLVLAVGLVCTNSILHITFTSSSHHCNFGKQRLRHNSLQSYSLNISIFSSPI